MNVLQTSISEFIFPHLLCILKVYVLSFQTYSDGSWRRGLYSFMLTVSLSATSKDSCGKNLIEKKPITFDNDKYELYWI